MSVYKVEKNVNLCHIYNSELMGIRYKGIWYKQLAVIVTFRKFAKSMAPLTFGKFPKPLYPIN